MLLQIRIAPKQIQNEETNQAGMELLESNKENSEDKTYATVEELKRGKLPPEEILSLPMFKVLKSLVNGSLLLFYKQQYY